MIPFKPPKVNYDLISLSGGLDQITPTLALPPGVARRAANFECAITGGYSRIAGYERFDGHASPSAANYNLLTCTITGTVAVGDTITGLVSGNTAKVIAQTATQLIVTREVSQFNLGEGFSVGGVLTGTIDAIEGVVANGLLDATYKNLAADDYRADISAVPGQGAIRGVAYYNGYVYAWRDAVGGLTKKIYKSSTAGWVEINLGYLMTFNLGTAEIVEGVTIVGASSGASAVAAHIIVQSGDWTTGDAAGFIVMQAITGAFTAVENINVGGITKAKTVSASGAITLAPGGRVETVISNFGGYSETPSLYGADGVNLAFELYDNDLFVPIYTGNLVDTPVHISAHKNHLFLTFGSSLQHSALGNPHDWSVVGGAGEIALNGTISQLLIMPGDQTTGALGVYTRNDTFILYGTSSANWQLASFNTGTGAYPYTGQTLNQAFSLDDRGIMTLSASLNYGNFDSSALTMNIRPFIQTHKPYTSGSLLNREKGQYRLFFSDSYGLYLTVLNGNVLGAMPVQFANPVMCCDGGENNTGDLASFFGSDNGFVYQLDMGTSFDGAAIPANINLVYNPIGAPRVLKRYRKASVEMTGDAYAEIEFGYDLGYRSVLIGQPTDAQYENDLRSAYWDAFLWDNFVWDGSDISPSEIEVNGTAENIAIRISSVSDLFESFTVNSIILHYTMRRGLR